MTDSMPNTPEEFEADDEAYDEPDRETEDPQTLRAELEAVTAERDALYEKLARVQADFQNSRRRIEQDSLQRLELRVGEVVKAMLPVLDNLERALQVNPEQTKTVDLLGGVEGVRTQFLHALRQQGAEPIAPEPGSPFDPSHMEALMQEPSDEYEEPTVTRLLQPGYSFNGRILRPAQVAVSRSS